MCKHIIYIEISLILKVLSQSRLLFEKTIKFLDVVFAAGLEAGDQCTALCYPSLESLEATGGEAQHESEGWLKLLNMLHCSWTASPGAREDDQSPIKVTDTGNQSRTPLFVHC